MTATSSEMKITEIAFTVYPVKDLKRARQFYEGVLGLVPSHQFGSDEMGMVEYDIGPGTLAIGRAPGWEPGTAGGRAALEVEDFTAAIARLREHGCKFIVEPFETPVCHMAILFDTEGNSLMIHKRKPGRENR